MNIQNPAEGLEPSRHEISGSILRHAAGRFGIFQEAGKIFLKTSILLAAFALLAPLSVSASVSLATPNTNALSEGLIDYWSMDGNTISWSTDTIKDLSGSGDTGNLELLSTTSAPVAGKIGEALKFNGTSYIVGSSVVNVPQVTIAAWVKLSAYPPSNRMIAGFANGLGSITYDKDLYVNSSGDLFFYVYDGAGKTTSTPSSPIPLNTWVFVVGTANGSSAQAYVNGVQVGSVAAGSTYTGYTVPDILVSGSSAVFGQLAATIDDVRTYNRALSAQEVALLYALGTIHIGNTPATNSSFSIDQGGLNGGLVGYWPLDGNTTSWTTDTTKDVSGNGDSGTLTGMSTTSSPVAGKIGGALNFNGSTSWINFGTPSSLQPANVTLSIWIKPTTTVFNWDFFAGSSGAGAWAGGYHFVTQAASTIEFCLNGYTGAGGTCVSLGSLSNAPAGAWTNLVGTYDGSTIKLYDNGVLFGQTSYSTPISYTAQTFRLGFGGGAIAFYSGGLDDVRVYNRALSAQEISDLYNAGQVNVAHSNTTSGIGINAGLVGYWTFDGPTINWRTNTVADMSGQGNTGTLINMSTTTSPVAGKIGQALSFNGTSNYVQTPNSSSIKPSLPITISAWIKLKSSPNGSTIFTSDSLPSNYAGYLLKVDSGNTIEVDYGNGGSAGAGSRQTKVSTGTVSLNAWHHVVAVIQGPTNMNIYIDGVNAGGSYSGTGGSLVYSGTTGGVGEGNVWNNTIGSFFPGIIDDMRVYSRALSVQEVQELYQMGR
jgi:hypothetical protein